MPSYYSPYNFYPASYANQFSGNAFQPMLPQQPVGPNCAMAWVDGEIEARGRQIPQGVTQFALWDTNQPVIYLKSLNQMGMPNPMQIIRYTVEETPQALQAGQSGDSGSSPDMSQYVTRKDLEQMIRNEIRSAMNTGNNQNGSNPGQNKGGNRNG